MAFTDKHAPRTQSSDPHSYIGIFFFTQLYFCDISLIQVTDGSFLPRCPQTPFTGLTCVLILPSVHFLSLLLQEAKVISSPRPLWQAEMAVVGFSYLYFLLSTLHWAPAMLAGIWVTLRFWGWSHSTQFIHLQHDMCDNLSPECSKESGEGWGFPFRFQLCLPSSFCSLPSSPGSLSLANHSHGHSSGSMAEEGMMTQDDDGAPQNLT